MSFPHRVAMSRQPPLDRRMAHPSSVPPQDRQLYTESLQFANLFYSVLELQCTLTFSWLQVCKCYTNTVQRQLCTEIPIYMQSRSLDISPATEECLICFLFMDARLLSGIYQLFYSNKNVTNNVRIFVHFFLHFDISTCPQS
jgi:hypothetical protein